MVANKEHQYNEITVSMQQFPKMVQHNIKNNNILRRAQNIWLCQSKRIYFGTAQIGHAEFK